MSEIMKQILLDNAYEAWKSAITFHNKIATGFSTLEYQKGFVASLHNATELFLKQIMLNENNHEVARMKHIKSVDDAKLQLKFFQADNLNHFFANLSAEQVNSFLSIGFEELRGIVFKLIQINEQNKESITAALKILQRLRNEETHFYINKNEYLTENDFCALHNYMILFYDAITPPVLNHIEADFSDTLVYKLTSQYKIMELSFTHWNSFSYKNALCANTMAREVAKYLGGENGAQYAAILHGTQDSYLLAEKIIDIEGLDKRKTMDYFSIVSLLVKEHLITPKREDEEVISDEGEVLHDSVYEMICDSNLV